MLIAIIAGALVALLVWVIIPAYLAMRYDLPIEKGLLMELLIVVLWLGRILHMDIPLD